MEQRARLEQRGDRGIVFHGASFLLEVLSGLDTRHDTPPSQAPSPIFGHISGAQSVMRSPARASGLVHRRLQTPCPPLGVPFATNTAASLPA